MQPPTDTLRIWRSWRSDFAGLLSARPDADLTDETLLALDVYDEAELARIAGAGFNGIWVHGILDHLVQTAPFLELGGNHRQHQAALRTLIARAGRHGIRVYLYLQPPRAIPVARETFWERHPGVGGQEETRADRDDPDLKVTVRALCVSTPTVRTWLRDACRDLAAALPGLGGLILITASELPAHCYSGRQPDDPRWMIECPRCRLRRPEDLVVDIIRAVRDGVRDVSPDLAVIAWNWSWVMWGQPEPCLSILDRLPADVIVMADFERGGWKDLWRRPRTKIDEYSLSYAGPSERCLKTFEAVQRRGGLTMSKLQLGTTHELASVVSLPLLPNLYRKAAYHRRHPSAGFMGCWNFGNQLSANTAAFNFFLSADCPDDEAAALRRFGAAYFPGCQVDRLVDAWHQFLTAMDAYPFCIPFIYSGPMNYALAYCEPFVAGPLNGRPAGPSHLIVPRGDDLSGAFDAERNGYEASALFPLDDIIIRMERLAAEWEAGCALLQQALETCAEDAARLEVGNAWICGAVWRSTAHAFKAYRLRREWTAARRAELESVARDELAVLRAVLPWVARDPRQGYHAEAHGHMFDVAQIQAKIAHLGRLLSR